MPLSVAIAATALSGAAVAAAPCSSPLSATTFAVRIPETQPRISWAAVPGATGYRLQLLSRVPNGRIVGSHDTVVTSTGFLPPQPLTDHHAKVRVRLTAMCGAETSAESSSWFLIDTSPRCVLEEFGSTVRGTQARVEWKAVPGAQTYEVRAHALGDGKLVASVDTRLPSAQLQLPEPAVVSVRPACATGLGEAVYRVVAAD
jgi:hypothetical protein